MDNTNMEKKDVILPEGLRKEREELTKKRDEKAK